MKGKGEAIITQKDDEKGKRSLRGGGPSENIGKNQISFV